MLRNFRRGAIIAMTLFWAAGWTTAPGAWAQDVPPMPVEELPAGAEVLTAGPVHEAFAEPVTMDAQAGTLVPRQPPASIEEAPPAERPAAAGVVWIPGYWAWSHARGDFIWISGCWRVAPPGMYWVPGYWAAVTGGWEWVAGFWAAAAQEPQEIQYLPAPPPAFETGPVGLAPTPDCIWTPGCWYWQDGRYIQRHGYWLIAHVGWIWTPAHYSWTPRGYVFNPAYWDHDMDARGVLFAPVWLPGNGVTLRAGFAFSPSVCVDLGMLRVNLFVSPRHSHYYFGDYYDPYYATVGIYPCFESERLRTWYDPIFAYDRWNVGRADPRWMENEHRRFDDRRVNPALRPPRTLVEMNARIAATPVASRESLRVVVPLRTFVTRPASPLRFETIATPERRRLEAQAATVHEFRNERTRWEGPAPVAPREAPRVIPSPTPAPAPAPAPAHRETPRGIPSPTPAPTPTPAPAHHDETPRVIPAPAPAPTPTPTPAHRETPRGIPTPTPAPAPAPVSPKPEHTGPFVPPRDVRATQAEKVTLPVAPPIINRPAPTPAVSPTPSRTAPPSDDRGHSRGPDTRVPDTRGSDTKGADTKGPDGSSTPDTAGGAGGKHR